MGGVGGMGGLCSNQTAAHRPSPAVASRRPPPPGICLNTADISLSNVSFSFTCGCARARFE